MLDDKSLAPQSLLGEFKYFGGQQSETRQYGSTGADSKDIRLMCWQPKADVQLIFNIFANNIIVAEVDLSLASDEFINANKQWQISQLEQEVQDQAKAMIRQHFDDFFQDLIKLAPHLPASLVLNKDQAKPDISWTARTLVVDDKSLQQVLMQHLLTLWLAKTNRPDDANDMIAGKKHYSLTWLNYAINAPQAVGEDPQLQIMVFCQYYYVLQEHCNSALRSVIEKSYSSKRDLQVDKLMQRTRTASRLSQISYFEHIKFLASPNRVLLEDILAGWKYDQLVENSERMIEVCDAKIQEEDNKKRERSTVMTDFLLVALSFFAVFELSLYLTEFSREMMSRPALDYNDSKSSFFLSVIAEIDADIMFSFGFGLTLVLILVYRYIKRH